MPADASRHSPPVSVRLGASSNDPLPPSEGACGRSQLRCGGEHSTPTCTPANTPSPEAQVVTPPDPARRALMTPKFLYLNAMAPYATTPIGTMTKV